MINPLFINYKPSTSVNPCLSTDFMLLQVIKLSYIGLKKNPI